MKLLLLLLLLLLSTAPIIISQELNWFKPKSGPDGGSLKALEVDKNNSNNLYAVASGYTLYSSSDKGKTWDINDNIKIHHQAKDVKKDPFTDNLYVIGKQLLKSEDNGKSFKAILDSVTKISCKKDFIYASVNDSVLLISYNQGESWVVKKIFPLNWDGYGYIFSDSLDNQIGFSTRDSLFISYDYGDNWTAFKYPRIMHPGLFFDPINSNAIFYGSAMHYDFKSNKLTEYCPPDINYYELKVLKAINYHGSNVLLIQDRVIYRDSSATFLYDPDQKIKVTDAEIFNDSLFFTTEDKGFCLITPDKKIVELNKGIKEIPIKESFQRGDSIFYASSNGLYFTTTSNPNECVKINNLILSNIKRKSEYEYFAQERHNYYYRDGKSLLYSNDGGYNWKRLIENTQYGYINNYLLSMELTDMQRKTMVSVDNGLIWEGLPILVSSVFADDNNAYIFTWEKELIKTNNFKDYTTILNKNNISDYSIFCLPTYISYDNTWIFPGNNSLIKFDEFGNYDSIPFDEVAYIVNLPKSSKLIITNINKGCYLYDSIKDDTPKNLPIYSIANNYDNSFVSLLEDNINRNTLIFGHAGFWAVKLDDPHLDIKEENFIVDEFNLYQNYPNPFNPTTTIKYSLPESNKVELYIYDVLGNKIATLINEEKLKGTHLISFNSNNYNLSSGIYFYQMKFNNKAVTKKFVLVK